MKSWSLAKDLGMAISRAYNLPESTKQGFLRLTWNVNFYPPNFLGDFPCPKRALNPKLPPISFRWKFGRFIQIAECSNP